MIPQLSVLRRLLALLLLGLVAQIASAAWRQSMVPPAGLPAVQLAVGDTVRILAGLAEDGEQTRVELAAPDRVGSVVYAFHPECSQGEAVAREWTKRWDAPPMGPRVRRIAVSHALPATAAAYARRADWKIEVLSVAHLEPTALGYVLASRTPWVFVFDAAGILRYHGHGNDPSAVDRSVRALAQRRSSDLEDDA